MNWGLKMSDRSDLDKALDAILSEMRAAAPEPRAELLARVLADAEAAHVAPGVGSPAAPRRVTRPAGPFARLAASFGGWGGVGGLLTATVAGLWIGLSGATASDTLSLVWSGDSAAASGVVDLMPGLGDFAEVVE